MRRAVIAESYRPGVDRLEGRTLQEDRRAQAAMAGINRKAAHLAADQQFAVNKHSAGINCDRSDRALILVEAEPCPCLAYRVLDVAPVKPLLLTRAEAAVQDVYHFFAIINQRNWSNTETHLAGTSVFGFFMREARTHLGRWRIHLEHHRRFQRNSGGF